jgi:NADH dehydrogenase FAD-containing subunit
VTIIEMLDQVAADMPAVPRSYLMRRLEQLGAKFVTGAKVEAITDIGVLVDRDGQKLMLEGFSTIVLALGSKSNNDLATVLSDLVDAVYVVGDAKQVARIVDATAQAAEVAMTV